MTRKLFLIVVVAILFLHGATLAKEKSVEIPMKDRLKIAVEVTDATNFTELNTAKILYDNLIFLFDSKNIFNTVNPTDENSLANIKTLENKNSSDVGELVIFPTKNLDFDKNFYENLGVEYVIRCEILGVGNAAETEHSFGFGNGVGIGIGSGDEFGAVVFGGVGNSLRKVYCTAVNMQLVEVSGGVTVARQNLTGKAVVHRKPKKGYNDASDEAYLKSIDNATKIIAKRVVNFAAKNFKQYKKVTI